MSKEHKCIVAIQMFGYDVASDFLDDYYYMGGSIIYESMKMFYFAIWEWFKYEYFKQPICANRLHQMNINEDRGYVY